MKSYLFILLLLIASPAFCTGEKDRMILDEANVLTEQERDDLENKLLKFKNDYQTEVFIVLKNEKVRQDGNEFAASIAKEKVNTNTLVIFADTYYHIYGFYVPDQLKNKLPEWVIEKIEDNNLKVNFRDKQYYIGLNEAITNIIGVISGKVTEEDLQKGSSGYIMLLILLVVFFIIIFPIIQFREMKKSHFSSKPVDLVSAVLLVNTFGTRGKNLFDNFSKGKGTFASKAPNALLSGGGGAAGCW